MWQDMRKETTLHWTLRQISRYLFLVYQPLYIPMFEKCSYVLTWNGGTPKWGIKWLIFVCVQYCWSPRPCTCSVGPPTSFSYFNIFIINKWIDVHICRMKRGRERKSSVWPVWKDTIISYMKGWVRLGPQIPITAELYMNILQVYLHNQSPT